MKAIIARHPDNNAWYIQDDGLRWCLLPFGDETSEEHARGMVTANLLGVETVHVIAWPAEQNVQYGEPIGGKA